MIRLYLIIAIFAGILFAIIKWRGGSASRSFAFSAALFLFLTIIATLLFWWGGDKATPGARTIPHDELQR
jgi:hypothetical protein